MSPEEVEGGEVETTETEVQPVEPEKPRRVEVDPDELKEMRETLRRQAEELHQHKLWQMQQYQQQKAPETPVDPDVERVIAPVVRKAMQPLVDENAQLKSQLTGLAEQARVQANIDYIERNIPNFDDIRQDLAREIESMPKAEQDLILSSPTLMVRLAKGLNSERGKSSKQETRSRTFTESSTGTSPSKNTSALGNVDWGNLTDAEFAAHEAKVEMARRKR
jgi:hypothetical protein